MKYSLFFRGTSTFPTASLLFRKLFFLHSHDLPVCSCCCQHPLCWSHRLPAPCCTCNRRIAPRAGVSSQASQKVSPAMVTSDKEDSLQARSTQCTRHSPPICHILTELKQKQYYQRYQNVGIPHLLLWDL